MDKRPHTHKADTEIYYAHPWAWKVFSLSEHNVWQYCATPLWRENRKHRLEPSIDHPSFREWHTWNNNPRVWDVYLMNPSAPNVWCKDSSPKWKVDVQYKIEPNSQHPSYAVWNRWRMSPNVWDIHTTRWTTSTNVGDDSPLSTTPQWDPEFMYRIAPNVNHPDYATYRKYNAHPHWYKVYYQPRIVCELERNNWMYVQTPTWNIEYKYLLVGNDIHPDNLPPRKLIDWLNLPIGTMTTHGELRGFFTSGTVIVEQLDNKVPRTVHVRVSDVDIAAHELQPWLLWTGGICPVSDDFLIEVTFRGDTTAVTHGSNLSWGHSNSFTDIIRYRIVGLRE